MTRIEAEQINEDGMQLLHEGKVEEALEKFSEAIEKDQTYAYPYCHIGNVLSAANHHEDALQWFQKAIELDEHMSTAYYGLGNALYSLDQFDQALEKFQQAEQKGLEHGDLYFMLGMTFMQKGEEYAPRALAYFQSAVDAQPEDMEAVFQRGLCSAYLGHLDQAKKDFQTVIAHDDQHADAYFNLGVAYAYEEKVPQALENFDRAIDIQPDHVLALNAKKQLSGEES